MSALSDLVNLLTKSREGVLPSIQAFPPLDIETIATDLQLETRAKESGSHNQPMPDTDLEDSLEGDILADIQRRAHKASEDYRSQLDLYDGRIQRAFLATNQRVAIEAAGESALTDFKVQALDDLDHLHNARVEVEGRERECEAFRTAHHLDRLPHLVSTSERIVRGLVLAVVVVLESMLNGSFFAQGSETGLIGGITQALVLAVLNVGSGVLYASYGLPLLRAAQHPTVLRWGVTVTYGLWALGLNLFIGHFRDLFIQHAGKVMVADLLSRLTTATLQFDDAQSLLLVALGIGLNILTVIDAQGMNDHDPRYGALGRRRTDAVIAYTDQKARCLADLTERRDAANDAFSRVIELMRTAEFDLRLAMEGRFRLHENYVAYLLHLKESYVRLLARYREANTSARSLPPPKRFTKRPAPLECLREPPPPQRLEPGDDERAHIIERMEFFIKAINAQFEAAVRQYQTVAGLTGETHHVNA